MADRNNITGAARGARLAGAGRARRRVRPAVPRADLDNLRLHVAHARALTNMLAGIVSESGIGDGEDLNDHTGQTQQAFALLDGLESNLGRIAQWMEDAEEAGGIKDKGGAA